MATAMTVMKLAAMMQVTLMMEMIVLYQSGASDAIFLKLGTGGDSQFAKVSLQGKLLRRGELVTIYCREAGFRDAP